MGGYGSGGPNWPIDCGGTIPIRIVSVRWPLEEVGEDSPGGCSPPSGSG